MRKMIDFFNHRRIILFWLVSIVGLIAPWLTSCTTRPISPTEPVACAVLSVYDGDTLTAKCSGERIKIRLYCIDAPEMGQRPWGKESRDYFRGLIPQGTEVDVRKHDRDRYGRTVGEVLRKRENVNLAMIEAGQSAVYDRFCEDSSYHKFEAGARKNSSGIWSKPGDHQRPWDWRKR